MLTENDFFFIYVPVNFTLKRFYMLYFVIHHVEFAGGVIVCAQN